MRQRYKPRSFVRSFFFAFISYLRPFYYPGPILALPPSSKSDPGSHSGPSSPLPTTIRVFIFIICIARIIQSFLPSSTRVELYKRRSYRGASMQHAQRCKLCACVSYGYLRRSWMAKSSSYLVYQPGFACFVRRMLQSSVFIVHFFSL